MKMNPNDKVVIFNVRRDAILGRSILIALSGIQKKVALQLQSAQRSVSLRARYGAVLKHVFKSQVSNVVLAASSRISLSPLAVYLFSPLDSDQTAVPRYIFGS
jgi:hypothetical protein